MVATNNTSTTQIGQTTTSTNARTATTANNSTSTSAPVSTSNPLADWLSGFLPPTIDFEDIAIRVGLVILGSVLLILVAWAFVRGKEQTTVNVQVPPTNSNASATQEAEEAAMVA